MGLKLEKAILIANEFPNTGNSPLAGKLYKENIALYKDKEDARTFIRKARGARGTKDREVIKSNSSVEQKKFPNGITYNPYQLPEEEHNQYKPFKIKVTKDTVIGLLSDLHFPYQSNEAITVALNECKRRKVTHLVINGDLLDAYSLSNFEKDVTKRNFKYEIDVVRAFLKVLSEKFKGVKIIFKEGNHDKRFITYMRRKAPELLGIEAFSLEMLLGLKELGITHIPDSQIIEAGSLIIIHGHEFGHQMFSPVNPARGFFMRAKTNVIGGHHHQSSSHSENRLDGKQIVSYSTGHLADPHPEYRPINNWSHGFAIIDHIQDGTSVNFIVDNLKIINGKIY